jgi:hypothetical protein
MIWTRLCRAGGAPSVRPAQRPAVFRVECLEDRSVPAAFPFMPNSFGGGSFNPFPGFTGPIETASGNISGGSVPDIITAEGPGPGSQSEVRIFSGAAAEQGRAVLIADFFPYSNVAGAGTTPGFAGGVFVAAADFTGGHAELVTSTGAGGMGHVKVFDFLSPNGEFLGSDPTLLTSFIVYPGFQGDVRVTTVDRGNGLGPLLVTASGAGTTASDIRVFANAASIGSIAPGMLVPPAAQMFAFPGYLGGVLIAGGGTTSNPELYLSPSVESPLVSVINVGAAGNDGVTLTQGVVFPTGTGNQPDIRLGAADIDSNGTLDVLTSSVGSTGATPISVYLVQGGNSIQLPDLTGFTGFGLFGGEWLYSGAFTATAAEQAAEVPAPAATTTGTAGTPGSAGTGITTSSSSSVPLATASVASPGVV